MMGRLLCSETSDVSRRAEDNRNTEPPQQLYMNSSVPLQTASASLPPIVPPPLYQKSSATLSQRSVSSFSEMPTLQVRAHSSFQDSPIHAEIKEVRSSAVSPNLKLPPILTNKAVSAPEVLNLPTQNLRLNSAAVDDQVKSPSLVDMRLAYENMMVSYFMPQSAKSENTTHRDSLQEHGSGSQQCQQNHFNSAYAPNPFASPPNMLNNYENYLTHPSLIADEKCSKVQDSFNAANRTNSSKHSSQADNLRKLNPTPISQQNSRDVTSSGYTLLPGTNFGSYQPASTDAEKMPKTDNFISDMLNNVRTITESDTQSNLTRQHSEIISGDQASNLACMSNAMNELSVFMPLQDNSNSVHAAVMNNSQSFSTGGTTIVTTTATIANNVNSCQYQTKNNPNWGRFSVIPPVMPNTTPLGGCISDSDNISLMSYNSVPNNAQGNPQMGMYHASFSPFSVNMPDNISSAFAPSPRYSGRSSYSGRGSRNKRALSNSPLSAEGIDLNSIIRMSPTSLIAYINGSRSSSSCISPGSAGEKTGCYGHLSARNSSSSPNSGSGSSGNRRSTSYTPQTSTPGNSNSRSILTNMTTDNSNISDSCQDTKSEFLNTDDNLVVMQAMQELESSGNMQVGGFNSFFPFLSNMVHPSQVIPEYENLQVLPQDIAAFRTEDLLPYVPPVLPPVHTHQQQQQQQYHPPLNQTYRSVSQHNKPPPTYDQHMARKATLQKNSSSESSQPSNSSSFESSEGDKTVGGSSSTDESNKTYVCKWLDCNALFQDQEEFVTHIEKAHVDQKKGDDFVCYWKLCPRRMHPFNARYKLLVHMRVHSGDKPNKCTYYGCKKAFSRLENLKIHLRSHTGERPYNCTFPGCTKTFSNSSDRTKHQKTHHDSKPYVCQVQGCDKRYTDPSSLRKHVKKSHPDKKEPDRKKIRGGVEDSESKDLNECLMIQAIKPITLCDGSPPEPTDSGLGRSPRSSQPTSCSDHYPGLIFPSDTLNRSETAQGSSSHTSPSSHQSSPPGPIDREKLPTNNNSLRVPILPPIVSCPNQSLSSTSRMASSRQESTALRNTSSLMQSPRLSTITSPSSGNRKTPLSFPKTLHQPRDGS